MKQNILCTIGNFDAEARGMLAALGTVRCLDMDRASLLKELGGVTVLITGLGHRIDEEILSAGPNLTLVATATTGTDHIDLMAAKDKRIPVISLQNDRLLLRSVTGTAELAFGLLIALIRNIPAAVEDVKRGAWKREDFCGHQLSGKTLGVLGVGRLGKMMVRYGSAFGMHVLGHDSTPHSIPDCTFVPLEQLLHGSDAISVHLPLTSETEGLLNAATLDRMKEGAVLVNTARGKIVDEAAILAALKTGHLAGYATDVLADEFSFGAVTASPLVDYAKSHNNILITPHIGGMTVEGRAATDVFIARKVRDTLSKQ